MSREIVTTKPRADSNSWPIYRALPDVTQVGAAYTGKGVSARNRNFSFHRPPASDPTDISKYFSANLQYLARREGFDPRRVTSPYGAWPHSGDAIKAEDYKWVKSANSKLIVPVTHAGQPVTYDAVATRSPRYVLGAQGADCPAVFLFEPHSNVIGLAHCGWKPLVRGVLENVLVAMIELGAKPRNIVAFISPGAGDRYNAFKWDDAMEPQVRAVFVKAGRSDLLTDPRIRHEMTGEDLARLSFALGRDIQCGTSLKLSYLAATELLRCGLSLSNIRCNTESTIVEEYSKAEKVPPTSFRYHSYRRDNPNHGLSMSVLFLKPTAVDHV